MHSHKIHVILLQMYRLEEVVISQLADKHNE